MVNKKQKKEYNAPKLASHGKVEKITWGAGGSKLDMDSSYSKM